MLWIWSFTGQIQKVFKFHISHMWITPDGTIDPIKGQNPSRAHTGPGGGWLSGEGRSQCGEWGDGGTKISHNSEEEFQQDTPNFGGIIQSVTKILSSWTWSLGGGCLYWNHRRRCTPLTEFIEQKFSGEKMSAGLHGQVQSIAVIYGSIKLSFITFLVLFLIIEAI